MTRVDVGALAIAFFTTSVVGCGGTDDTSAATYCYDDPADMAVLEAGLKRKKIEFTRDAGCILIDRTLQDQVPDPWVERFGAPPPPGRNISRGAEGNQAVVDLLGREGIQTSIVRYRDLDFVTWSEEDADRVEELLALRPEQREMMQRLRKEDGDE